MCVCEPRDACDWHMAACATCPRPCQGHSQQVEVLYNLRQLGVYHTLKAAWLALKERIQRDIDSGSLSYLSLEQMVHLQPVGNNRPDKAMGFYQVRDIAADHGW